MWKLKAGPFPTLPRCGDYAPTRVRFIHGAIEIDSNRDLLDAILLSDKPIILVMRHTLQISSPPCRAIGRVIRDVLKKR